MRLLLLLVVPAIVWGANNEETQVAVRPDSDMSSWSKPDSNSLYIGGTFVFVGPDDRIADPINLSTFYCNHTDMTCEENSTAIMNLPGSRQLTMHQNYWHVVSWTNVDDLRALPLVEDVCRDTSLSINFRSKRLVITTSEGRPFGETDAQCKLHHLKRPYSTRLVDSDEAMRADPRTRAALGLTDK